MTHSLSRGIACLLTASALSACGTIKQWFPDKEKEYQFTTELPELVLPPDLTGNQFPSLPLAAPAPVLPAEPAVEQEATPPETSAQQTSAPPISEPNVVDPAAGTESAVAEPAPEPTAPANPIDKPSGSRQAPYPVDWIASENQPRLRIRAPFINAWRSIDKALSRKSIEVSSRDSAKKQFAVRYDPEEHQIQDSSFWDEFDFIFFGLQGNEKAYLLKLTEDQQWTDVTIFNPEHQPATDAGAVKLMKLLEETLKTDFSR